MTHLEQSVTGEIGPSGLFRLSALPVCASAERASPRSKSWKIEAPPPSRSGKWSPQR